MKRSHFILFENHKLLYGRVPKVANSSIKARLTGLLNLPPTGDIKTTSDSFWKTSTNNETRMITPREARKLRKTHFSFAFVRNPFDRLVSAYNNKIIENETMSQLMRDMGLVHGMSFPDFIDAVCATAPEMMDPHLMPQSTMLVFKGALVPKFIGRFEQMDKDWKILQKAMTTNGLAHLGKLPKKNVRREPGGELYGYFSNQDLIDKIAAKYAEDLAFFYSGISVDQLLRKELPSQLPPIGKTRSKYGKLGALLRWFRGKRGQRK